AAVVPARCGWTRGHALARRPCALLGPAGVAAAATRNRQRPRSRADPLPAVRPAPLLPAQASGAAALRGGVPNFRPAAARASAWRHQFPAHSPLSPAAVLAGVAAATGGTSRHRCAARLIALLNERYSPRAVLLTDSGTTALTAALRGVLQQRPGSAVALPAFSCY